MLKVYNLALIGFGIGMVELYKKRHKTLYNYVSKQGQVPTSLDYVGGI